MKNDDEVETVTIKAPPGSLGLVLCKTTDGIKVRNVSTISPLLSQIYPGDIISEIDGIYTGCMDISTFVRNMMDKADQKVRFLKVVIGDAAERVSQRKYRAEFKSSPDGLDGNDEENDTEDTDDKNGEGESNGTKGTNEDQQLKQKTYAYGAPTAQLKREGTRETVERKQMNKPPLVIDLVEAESESRGKTNSNLQSPTRVMVQPQIFYNRQQQPSLPQSQATVLLPPQDQQHPPQLQTPQAQQQHHYHQHHLPQQSHANANANAIFHSSAPSPRSYVARYQQLTNYRKDVAAPSVNPSISPAGVAFNTSHVPYYNNLNQNQQQQRHHPYHVNNPTGYQNNLNRHHSNSFPIHYVNYNGVMQNNVQGNTPATNMQPNAYNYSPRYSYPKQTTTTTTTTTFHPPPYTVPEGQAQAQSQSQAKEYTTIKKGKQHHVASSPTPSSGVGPKIKTTNIISKQPIQKKTPPVVEGKLISCFTEHEIASMPVCFAFHVDDVVSENDAASKQNQFDESMKKSIKSRDPSVPAKLVKTEPAPNLPDGWSLKYYARQNGNTKGRLDRYWYSPKKKFKFRSTVEIKTFLESLEEVGGNDEESAFALFKQKRGR